MNLRPLLLPLALAVASPALAAAESTGSPIDATELAVLAAKTDSIVATMLDQHASEYKPARVYKRLKSQQLGEKSIVVFTLEGFGGGNNYQFYLALFDATEDQFAFLDVMRIGGKAWRQVEFSSAVANGRYIEFDTLEYADKDAMCCPSVKGKARFAVDRDHLSEIKTAEQPTR